MTTIGIIGAGNIGSQLARLAVQHGHQVVIANSRGPETLTDLVAELGEHATAGTREDAATRGDIVVVTVPLGAVETIPVEPLVGKVVIDTDNYYPERDGHIVALDDETTTTAEMLQDHLVGAHVVKAFNHIGAADLTGHATPSGTEDAAPWSSRATTRRRSAPSPTSSTSSASTSSTPDRSPRDGASSATPRATARA